MFAWFRPNFIEDFQWNNEHTLYKTHAFVLKFVRIMRKKEILGVVGLLHHVAHSNNWKAYPKFRLIANHFRIVFCCCFDTHKWTLSSFLTAYTSDSSSSCFSVRLKFKRLAYPVLLFILLAEPKAKLQPKLDTILHLCVD